MGSSSTPNLISQICWVPPFTNVPSALLEKAASNVSALLKIIDNRQELLRTTNPDNRAFLTNGGNWNIDGSVGHIQLYKTMLRHGMDGLSRLRWFTQCLSGYSSLLMQGGPGSPYVDFETRRGEYVVRYPLLSNKERPLTTDALHDIVASRMSTELRWVYAWMLLHQRVPETLQIAFPPIAGESGFECDGHGILNYEAFYFLRYLVLMFDSGVIAHIDALEHPAIMELGAGFGALIYGLQHYLKRAKFYIVDIPESLIFSAAYLSMACPDRICTVVESPDDIEKWDADFICIPNTIFLDCIEKIGHIDLSINTASMNEMGPHQVDYYGKVLSKILGDDGIFFEVNYAGSHCNHAQIEDVMQKHFKNRTCIDWHGLPFDKGETPVPNLWSNLIMGKTKRSVKAPRTA